MSAPLIQLFPVKLLWKRILLAQIEVFNQEEYQYFASVYVPFSGILRININMQPSGQLVVRRNGAGLYGYALGGGALNGGNTLNSNTWYEFDLYVAGGDTLDFLWFSSSSSTTVATIHMLIYLDLREEESGSE